MSARSLRWSAAALIRMPTVVPTLQALVCTVCTRVFTTIRGLKVHAKSHRQGRLFREKLAPLESEPVEVNDDVLPFVPRNRAELLAATHAIAADAAADGDSDVAVEADMVPKFKYV